MTTNKFAFPTPKLSLSLNDISTYVTNAAEKKIPLTVYFASVLGVYNLQNRLRPL